MNRPLIFEEYDYSKASTQFPLIEPWSSEKEVEDTAWQYTIDLMKDDYDIMFESFVGEHLDNILMMRKYHDDVLQALADQNYKKIGKLVEGAMGAFNDKTVEYIQEHQAQMEMRNV
tara:strand:- start:1843 stop:2190 length:348 start_codon:yes stop_codon:yes gene_type:complete